MDFLSLVAESDVQPRPYQERIVTKAVDLFQNRQLRSILIESPTGATMRRAGSVSDRSLSSSGR